MALGSLLPDIHTAFGGGLRVEYKLHEGPRIQGRRYPYAAPMIAAYFEFGLLTSLDPAPREVFARFSPSFLLLTRVLFFFFPAYFWKIYPRISPMMVDCVCIYIYGSNAISLQYSFMTRRVQVFELAMLKIIRRLCFWATMYERN